MPHSFAAPFALLAALAAASLAAAQPGPRASVERLWADNCAKCHAPDGRGGGAGTSSLLDDEWFEGRTGTDRELFDSIKTGHPDAGMEGFGATLTDPQIWGLVVHLRELRERDRRARVGSPTATDGVYPSQHHPYKLERVVDSGLRTPWSVAFLPGGALLITERSGRLRQFDAGTLSAPIPGTPPVRAEGQGGLMDVELHPDFAQNGWVYLAFSDPATTGNAAMTKVVRGRIKDARWTDQETIFQARPESYLPGPLHFGCRLVFTPKDAQGNTHLFFAIGERGRGDHAQDLTRPNGKIHRVRDDGAIPDDNPFNTPDQTSKGVYATIWSYGHRNPQGLVLDAAGNLWDTEHGPRGGDELNLVAKGANHGWPLVSFGINYNGAPLRTPWPEPGQNFAMPTFLWTPSIGACGLDIVRGKAFPKWEGDFVAGGLSGTNVDRLRVRDGAVTEREELVHGQGRVRDVATAPDGTVYVVLNMPDRIVRLVPEKPAPQ